MQDWVIILIYALVAAAYAVIHELFFRFRFKELFFTFGFLTLTFMVCMFATSFQNVFVWLTTVSIIESILLAVYAAVCMRVARDRVLRKMQGPGGMAEMLNMMSGKIFGEAPDPFEGKGSKAEAEDEEPVIVVTEEKPEGGSASHEEELKYYDLGDVIIDGSEEHDEDEKED